MQALFARLEADLARAGHELARAERLAESAIVSGPDGEVVRAAFLAHAVADAYEGIEGILAEIAKEIDDYLPRGEDWHRKLLTQLAMPLEAIREAVLSEESLALLYELRAFRHVVHHRYGSDLRWTEVNENLARMHRALPLFSAELAHFARTMLDDES